MRGQSLVADALAVVLYVHTLIFPKEQKRLNVRLGARSWVLLGHGDCPGGSHGGVHKHWPSTRRPEATEISLKVYQANEEWLGEWIGEKDLQWWVGEFGEWVKESKHLQDNASSPQFCLVLHRWLCSQQWGLQHFRQVSVSFGYRGYTQMAGTERVHSANCCSGWEVVSAVSNEAGPEMSLLG